jgi:hypothetical protein
MKFGVMILLRGRSGQSRNGVGGLISVFTDGMYHQLPLSLFLMDCLDSPAGHRYGDEDCAGWIPVEWKRWGLGRMLLTFDPRNMPFDCDMGGRHACSV